MNASTDTNERESSATDLAFELLGYQKADLPDLFGHNDTAEDPCPVDEALRFLASLKS